MVKNVIIMALYMLNMTFDAEYLEEGKELNAIHDKLLRYYNLVVDEIASEYVTDAVVNLPYGLEDSGPEIFGITDRMLAYGVVAEHYITEGNEECVTWDKRYKDAIAGAKRRAVNVKERSFI